MLPTTFVPSAPYTLASRVLTAVTPNDNNDLTPFAFRGLYIGGTGNVAVVPVENDQTVVTFSAVPVGTILPIQVRKVKATGTTATLIIALS